MFTKEPKSKELLLKVLWFGSIFNNTESPVAPLINIMKYYLLNNFWLYYVDTHYCTLASATPILSYAGDHTSWKHQFPRKITETTVNNLIIVSTWMGDHSSVEVDAIILAILDWGNNLKDIMDKRGYTDIMPNDITPNDLTPNDITPNDT